jgi:hypothetical protein
MSDRDDIRQRTLEAAHLQTIEGNPLDAEQIAMFDMFDREGFLPDQESAYVITRIRVQAETKTKQ